MSDKKKLTAAQEKEIIELAKKRYKTACEAWKDNYRNALDDLKFQYEPGAQWDEAEKNRRKKRGRPCLEVNVLPKYTKQVAGEMRKNKVRIKVHPEDSKADQHLARIREGMIRDVEYRSDAESVYDYAGKMAVDCGFGAWRVLTRAKKENPFQQEAYLERILNPLSVKFDPEAKERNFCDARYCFIEDVMLRDTYEDKYGKIAPGSSMSGVPDVGSDNSFWWSADTITVAEYFWKETSTERMAQLSDGQTMSEKDAEKFIADWTAQYEAAKAAGQQTDESYLPTISKVVDVETVKIKWATITGEKVIDHGEIPGEYIPVVMNVGEETNIAGKRIFSGLIRNGKDAQRLLDYWHTALAETVALAPKSQWIGTPKMFKGFEKDFAAANDDNLPFLKAEMDNGILPQRVSPGQVSPALFAERQNAEESIKSAIGMFNADVGDVGRELSGAAIMARQLPGDTATFTFPDNLYKSIAYGGKIINSMLDEIADTEQDAKLRNEDDSESFVPINTTVGKALKAINGDPRKFAGMDKDKLKEASAKSGLNADFNKIGTGKYGVIITTGPTFATQRAEAAANLIQLAQVSVNMAPLDKYFTIKAMSFEGSEEYAEAIRKTIPYGVLPPKDGEKPPEPPQPSPQDQAAIVRLQFEAERMKTERFRQQVAILKLIKEMRADDVEARERALKMFDSLVMTDMKLSQAKQTGPENKQEMQV